MTIDKNEKVVKILQSVKRILREHCEQLQTNKHNKLDEAEKFWKTQVVKIGSRKKKV